MLSPILKRLCVSSKTSSIGSINDTPTNIDINDDNISKNTDNINEEPILNENPEYQHEIQHQPEEAKEMKGESVLKQRPSRSTKQRPRSHQQSLTKVPQLRAYFQIIVDFRKITIF